MGSLQANCGVRLTPPLGLQRGQLLLPLRRPELQQPCSCCGQPLDLDWRRWNLPGLASCCLGFQQALLHCWVSHSALHLRTWSAGQAYLSGRASCRGLRAPCLPGRVLCHNCPRRGRLQQDASTVWVLSGKVAQELQRLQPPLGHLSAEQCCGLQVTGSTGTQS